MSDPAALPALLDALWERFGGVAEERVTVLEAYVAALAGGEDPPPLRAEAAAAAHKLAGALGTYGRPGSPEAARLQELLEADGGRDEVPALVGRVRAAVEGGQLRSGPEPCRPAPAWSGISTQSAG